MLKCGTVYALILLLGLCGPALAQVGTEPQDEIPAFHNDHWHVAISPYLWMAGMSGTMSIGNHEATVNQSFADIFSNLKFGLMGLTEVRRGRIGFLSDFMWVDLNDEKSVPIQGLPTGVDVNMDVNTLTFTQYVGYRILGNHHGTIDYLGGGRYYHVHSKLSANANLGGGGVSDSKNDNWADFVQGARFTYNFTPKIGAFFAGDAGGGGSQLTYQIVAGMGYRWGKRWSTEVGYRRLYFDRTRGDFGLEQTQQGILLGATFRLK